MSARLFNISPHTYLLRQATFIIPECQKTFWVYGDAEGCNAAHKPQAPPIHACKQLLMQEKLLVHTRLQAQEPGVQD